MIFPSKTGDFPLPPGIVHHVGLARGGYEVVKELGSGGFGKVNLVRERATGDRRDAGPFSLG